MTTLSITRRNDSPYLPVASHEITMHNEIETVVNGNLDKNNFQPPALGVTTLSGLAGRKGKVALLRVNSITGGGFSTNYQTYRFVYDDVLAKWVSDPVLLHRQYASLNILSATSYTDVPYNNEITEAWITNTASLYTAGARPQFWLGGRIFSSDAAGSIKARIRMVEQGNTDSSFGTTIFHSNEITNNGNLGLYKTTDWHTGNLISTPSGTDKGSISVVDIDATNFSGTAEDITAYMRWVSA